MNMKKSLLIALAALTFATPSFAAGRQNPHHNTPQKAMHRPAKNVHHAPKRQIKTAHNHRRPNHRNVHHRPQKVVHHHHKNCNSSSSVILPLIGAGLLIAAVAS